MAFVDPITITINSIAFVLNKISEQGLTTVYQTGDQNLRLEISHQVNTKTDRIRTVVKMTQRKVVADPLTSVNDYDTMQYHSVIDRPGNGWTKTEVVNNVAGLDAWMSDAVVEKLFELQH